MYLKSLQVIGFKSFADRTTIEFHPGVTAIVGPNGCGKSNVLDSIRWVLGEQSAKALRGGEMKDVIFSGSETRPPLGLAEVSLTFSDCEKDLDTAFNEVTVTRRVFRDGVGEYEINKTGCRLRDIQSLFMDTGIGRSAYSIMEQGKIDLILSSRPEDRRAIFEEAAGVTKYKSQKKEALRKLEATDANLVRLTDIIREVARQINSLQRQAGKARRYQSGFAELELLEHRIARHQFARFLRIISELSEEVDSSQARQDQLSLSLAHQETETAAARADLSRLEATLVHLREEKNRVTNALEQALARITTNQARVEEFEEMGKKTRQEIETIREKIDLGENQLAHLDLQVEQCKTLRHETEQKFEAARQNVAATTRAVAALLNEIGEIDKQRAGQERSCQKQEQEAAALDLQQQNFQIRLQALREEQKRAEQLVLEGRKTVQEHRERLELDEADLRQKKDGLQSVLLKRQEREEGVRRAEKARVEASQIQQARQARRDALAQLQEQHVSAPQATQRLLKMKASDLLGTVADQISVLPGYEKPLALLLGEAVHALLVERPDQAESWRMRLQGNEKCLFAPLQLARPGGSENNRDDPLSRASRFLTVQPLLVELLDALLEEAHVTATLAEAWALKSARPSSLIATQSGELVTRSGLMIAGLETGAALAVFARQAELRQLESEAGAALEKVGQADQALEAALLTFRQETAQVEQSRAVVQDAEIAVATERQKVQNSRAALEQTMRQSEQIGRDLSRLMTQQVHDEERRNSLREAIAVAQQARSALEEKSALLQTRLTAMRLEETEKSSFLTELRIELASQSHRTDGWLQQREPVARRLKELEELAGRRFQEVEEHGKRVEQATREIHLAEKMKKEKEEEAGLMETRLEQILADRTEALLKIETREASIRALRKELAEVQNGRAGREVRLAEQRLALTNLRDRFRRNYQKELEDLAESREPAGEKSGSQQEEAAETDWGALEEEAAQKRAALDALGPVNLEAISEYDELEERHRFLVAQETDLVNAKGQLLQAIREINQTTQKLFAETFEQVKKNFQEMFAELFGGGKASLVLLDESDPLESGIDIVAKPPGKQTQNVSLMSGGEKTMTAVALLFSIYLVKPSPFCVLDEMDAPLDESNINRFIRILLRFVHQSQFIVITHNKRTISIADVLYGVTMEERGVSRLVSMRLQKQDKEAVSSAQSESREDGVPSLAEAVVGQGD